MTITRERQSDYSGWEAGCRRINVGNDLCVVPLGYVLFRNGTQAVPYGFSCIMIHLVGLFSIYCQISL